MKEVDVTMFTEIMREDWSNNACLGYAILGAMRLGYDEDHISDFVSSIRSEFDFVSVDEAKSVYEKSPY